jgi:hypothetical protein
VLRRYHAARAGDQGVANLRQPTGLAAAAKLHARRHGGRGGGRGRRQRSGRGRRRRRRWGRRGRWARRGGGRGRGRDRRRFGSDAGLAATGEEQEQETAERFVSHTFPSAGPPAGERRPLAWCPSSAGSAVPTARVRPYAGSFSASGGSRSEDRRSNAPPAACVARGGLGAALFFLGSGPVGDGVGPEVAVRTHVCARPRRRGRRGGPQAAAPSRAGLRARAMGGATVGRPRWARMVSMRAGSSTSAMIRRRPPQGQA